MGRWIKIPWIGAQNTMGRGVNMPMGMGLHIPLVGGQNTMGK